MTEFNSRIVVGDYQHLYDWVLKMGDIYQASPIAAAGGALYVSLDGKRVLTTEPGEGVVTFKGNTITCDGNGGAIYITGGTSGHFIKNALFEENSTIKTAGMGGALYCFGASLTIDNSTFTKNYSGQAGALAFDNSKGYVSNTKFIDNESGNEAHECYAAALYVHTGSTVTVNNCTFSGSTTASDKGGAIGVNYQAALILQGENILAGESDTIFLNENSSGIVFDVSGNTTRVSSTKALLNHFDYIHFASTLSYDNNNLYFTIQVSNTQRRGVYVIAQDASQAGSAAGFKNFVVSNGTEKQLIFVNGKEPSVFLSGKKYWLMQSKTDSKDLLLVVDLDDFIFVNNEWKGVPTEERSVTYRGVVFDDNNKWGLGLYDGFAAAVEKAKGAYGKLIGVDGGTVGYSVELQGVETELNSGEFGIVGQGGAVTGGMIVGGTASFGQNAIAYAGSNLTIVGGTYHSNVIGSDYVQGKAVTETKGSFLEIVGGTFDKAIAGGMYANGTSGTKATLAPFTGNAVDMTISGGVYDGRIYGGNYAKDDASGTAANSIINGNISITIDCSNKTVINDGIVAGSRGTGTGMVIGNTMVTFTGDGNNLDFGKEKDVKVWGGCNMDSRRFRNEVLTGFSTSVTGTRSLVFDAFTENDFGAKIGLFSDLQAINGSKVTFTNADLDTSDVSRWVIDAGSSLAGLRKNDFKGDSLEFNGIEGTVLMSGTEDSFRNLDLAKEGGVFINGKMCTYNNGCWSNSEAGLKLLVENNSLKLAALV